MYVPTVFEQTDRNRLHDFIEAYSFGLLVSMSGDEPTATHLPFLLERDAGPQGSLIGHMAKANSQWGELADRVVLVVFSGPHAYVSPRWYESDEVVPTWNYVAVHAYGKCHLVEDSTGLTRILEASVATFERGMPRPWSIDVKGDFFEKLVRAVVGFRIEISRLEGKWKLSQNHPKERRDRVAKALTASADQDATEIARLMTEMLSNGERGASAP